MTPDELRAEAARLVARADELDVQLTRADLVGMSPDAIVTAKAEGRLNAVLGIEQAALPERATLEDLRAVAAAGHHDLIAEARQAGRLDHLFEKDA